MGRRDHQVKVQGYRIDILEIEKSIILGGYPIIIIFENNCNFDLFSHAKNCAVTLVDIDEQKHLVAFVVPPRTVGASSAKNFKYILFIKLLFVHISLMMVTPEKRVATYS